MVALDTCLNALAAQEADRRAVMCGMLLEIQKTSVVVFQNSPENCTWPQEIDACIKNLIGLVAHVQCFDLTQWVERKDLWVNHLNQALNVLAAEACNFPAPPSDTCYDVPYDPNWTGDGLYDDDSDNQPQEKPKKKQSDNQPQEKPKKKQRVGVTRLTLEETLKLSELPVEVINQVPASSREKPDWYENPATVTFPCSGSETHLLVVDTGSQGHEIYSVSEGVPHQLLQEHNADSPQFPCVVMALHNGQLVRRKCDLFGYKCGKGLYLDTKTQTVIGLSPEQASELWYAVDKPSTEWAIKNAATIAATKARKEAKAAEAKAEKEAAKAEKEAAKAEKEAAKAEKEAAKAEKEAAKAEKEAEEKEMLKQLELFGLRSYNTMLQNYNGDMPVTATDAQSLQQFKDGFDADGDSLEPHDRRAVCVPKIGMDDGGGPCEDRETLSFLLDIGSWDCFFAGMDADEVATITALLALMQKAVLGERETVEAYMTKLDKMKGLPMSANEAAEITVFRSLMEQGDVTVTAESLPRLELSFTKDDKVDKRALSLLLHPDKWSNAYIEYTAAMDILKEGATDLENGATDLENGATDLENIQRLVKCMYSTLVDI